MLTYRDSISAITYVYTYIYCWLASLHLVTLTKYIELWVSCWFLAQHPWPTLGRQHLGKEPKIHRNVLPGTLAFIHFNVFFLVPEIVRGDHITPKSATLVCIYKYMCMCKSILYIANKGCLFPWSRASRLVRASSCQISAGACGQIIIMGNHGNVRGNGC